MIRTMNDARLAAGVSPEFRRKMCKIKMKDWKTRPPEERAAHAAMMRAARRPDFGKRAWATRRQKSASTESA
jgi:hypothetical protein